MSLAYTQMYNSLYLPSDYLLLGTAIPHLLPRRQMALLSHALFSYEMIVANLEHGASFRMMLEEPKEAIWRTKGIPVLRRIPLETSAAMPQMESCGNGSCYCKEEMKLLSYLFRKQSQFFFSLALELMVGDVGAAQEVIRLLATETGLSFIKDVIDRHTSMTGPFTAGSQL